MADGLWLFIIHGVVGILYIVYCIVYRKRITRYTQGMLQRYSYKYEIVKEHLFLKAKLYAGLIKGIYILLVSIGGYLYEINNSFGMGYSFLSTIILVIYIINYTFIYYTYKKGYLKKTKN